jgi:hypothetical protein
MDDGTLKGFQGIHVFSFIFVEEEINHNYHMALMAQPTCR